LVLHTVYLNTVIGLLILQNLRIYFCAKSKQMYKIHVKACQQLSPTGQMLT